MTNRGFHTGVAEMLARIPTPDGKRFAVAFERGSLTLELYAPRGVDPQQPHTRDEVYVVFAGRGQFLCGESRRPFGAGDILFVPAGVVHRFEDFSGDFVTWVMFYGKEDGEAEGVSHAGAS